MPWRVLISQAKRQIITGWLNAIAPLHKARLASADIGFIPLFKLYSALFFHKFFSDKKDIVPRMKIVQTNNDLER